MNYLNSMTARVFELQTQMRKARNLPNKQEALRVRRILLSQLIRAMKVRKGHTDPKVLQIIFNIDSRAKEMGLRNYGQ